MRISVNEDPELPNLENYAHLIPTSLTLRVACSLALFVAGFIRFRTRLPCTSNEARTCFLIGMPSELMTSIIIIMMIAGLVRKISRTSLLIRFSLLRQTDSMFILCLHNINQTDFYLLHEYLSRLLFNIL